MEPRKRRNAKMAVLAVVSLLSVAVPAAYADSNRTVSGRGDSANFLCPSGVATPATIQFSATKNKGTLFGNFNIFGPTVSKFGTITGGSVNQNSFSLTGVVNFDTCGTFTSQLPATATITGD